uniref:Uncharacterized protein n=1 Tax=Wuchereria bancrofti TaxID=6293 RepID=A0A1I8EIJ7_WUCBA
RSSCKRKQLGFLKAGPSIIRDEFSGSTKVDERDEVGKEKNLKPSYNSMDFDEFSDFNDEFEIENHPKLDAVKTNEKNQFSSYREFHKLIHSYASSFLEGNSWIIFQDFDIKSLYYIDAEFSSSDDTEFSPNNHSDFPRSKDESIAAFKNILKRNDPEYQFHTGLFFEDGISALVSYFYGGLKIAEFILTESYCFIKY